MHIFLCLFHNIHKCIFSKNKKQQVRYEDTGIALANANDFEAGLREEVIDVYIYVFTIVPVYA